MSVFAASWLARREAVDAAACAEALVCRLARWAAGRGAPLRILDLGAGTGALLRHLAPRLPVFQLWELVECDPRLRAAGSRRLRARPPPRAQWRWIAADLAQALESLLDPPPDLVTASALLDLVSDAWLRRLLARLGGAAFYARLTCDGRIALAPAHPLDAAVLRLFRAHQRRDKGFGPALGAAAPQRLERLLPGIARARSDWRLGPGARALQAGLVAGWAEAASLEAPARAAAIAAWRRFRLEALARGASRMRIGHRDHLRLPDAPAPPLDRGRDRAHHEPG